MATDHDSTGRKARGIRAFTLVEVIVVAVIVGVLALASVLLYMGYTADARSNAIENLAASASSFLNSARNLEAQVPGPGINASLDENGQWQLSNGCVFRCPRGTAVDINAGDKTVTARYTNYGVVSSPYKYDN